jgi:hypothetical protein
MLQFITDNLNASSLSGMGAAIWNPVTSYDRTIFVSDFVWRSHEISIYEYELVGVERYPSYGLTWTGIFCFDVSA